MCGVGIFALYGTYDFSFSHTVGFGDAKHNAGCSRPTRPGYFPGISPHSGAVILVFHVLRSNRRLTDAVLEVG